MSRYSLHKIIFHSDDNESGRVGLSNSAMEETDVPSVGSLRDVLEAVSCDIPPEGAPQSYVESSSLAAPSLPNAEPDLVTPSSNNRFDAMPAEIKRGAILGTWQDLAIRCVEDKIESRGREPPPPLHPFLGIGPVPPNHLRVNVSGSVFDISLDKVKKYPNSLFCSPDLQQYYNPQLGEYFFDRNRIAFEIIVQFLQSPRKADILQFPASLPSKLVEMELEFYRIGWRYFVGTFGPGAQAFGKIDFITVKEKAFAFFNYPEWSWCAKSYMYLDLFFIFLSIGQFIMESDPTIKGYLEEKEVNTIQQVFSAVSWTCLVFFSVDIVARGVVSLDRLKFLLDLTMWLDIISLLPFYVDVFQEIIVPDVASNSSALQLLKIARISRCLKIVRRSETLLTILDILAGCSAELALLSFVWLIGVLLSGTLLFFAENELMRHLLGDGNASVHNTSLTYSNGTVYYEQQEWFSSIMESCWQAVVVIGTVGYGNIYPFYPIGKFLTSAIIFLSSLLMAIPMTIIIKRFSQAYEVKNQETSLKKVFGGKIDGSGSLVPTIESREMTIKQRAILEYMTRYRGGDTMYKDIITYLKTKLIFHDRSTSFEH